MDDGVLEERNNKNKQRRRKQIIQQEQGIGNTVQAVTVAAMD